MFSTKNCCQSALPASAHFLPGMAEGELPNILDPAHIYERRKSCIKLLFLLSYLLTWYLARLPSLAARAESNCQALEELLSFIAAKYWSTGGALIYFFKMVRKCGWGCLLKRIWMGNKCIPVNWCLGDEGGRVACNTRYRVNQEVLFLEMIRIKLRETVVLSPLLGVVIKNNAK